MTNECFKIDEAFLIKLGNIICLTDLYLKNQIPRHILDAAIASYEIQDWLKLLEKNGFIANRTPRIVL